MTRPDTARRQASVGYVNHYYVTIPIINNQLDNWLVFVLKITRILLFVTYNISKTNDWRITQRQACKFKYLLTLKQINWKLNFSARISLIDPLVLHAINELVCWILRTRYDWETKNNQAITKSTSLTTIVDSIPKRKLSTDWLMSWLLSISPMLSSVL